MLFHTSQDFHHGRCKLTCSIYLKNLARGLHVLMYADPKLFKLNVGQNNGNNAADEIPSLTESGHQPFSCNHCVKTTLLHRHARLQRPKAVNHHDSLVRRKREMLHDELSDGAVLIIFKPHPEYDLEHRVKRGPGEKIRVDVSPVSSAQGRTQVCGTRTV